MSKKNDLEHTSTTLGSQNMKSSQRMVSVVEPYELPEGWKWCRLGEVCKFENGYAFKSDKFAKQGIPVVRITNLKDNEVSLEDCVYTTEDNIEERFIVKKGDLLIAMSGATTGKNGVYLFDKIVYLNQRVGNIKVIDSTILNDKYRNFYIQAKEQDILKNAYGGAQPNISSTKICAMPFPLPPTLAEQQRIVNRIESMFAKLDEAKEKAQNVVDGFETRKAAILHKAFTGELTAKWRKENGVSDDSWEEKTIGECGKWERGRSKHRPRNAPELFGGEYPFIQTGDIANADVYIYEHKQTLSEFGFQQSRLFPKDTLCITIAANIGKVAILTYDCCFPDSVVGFTPFTDVDSKFMYFAISNIEKDLDSMAPATAQKNLNLKLLTAVKIKLPIFAEQQEIVHILDTILEKESRAKEAAQTVLAQIALLKKSILARAFRGKI